MDAVKKDVEALVKKELEAANKKFPLFNSAHEGYAVLLEEAEELDSDSASIKYDMQCLWGAVKGNNTEAALETISHTYERAVNAAVEAIQTAAMCEKFKMSLNADKTRDGVLQNADKVHCKDCDYLNTDGDKPFCCHPKMSTNGLDDWCCHGKKRGEENA